jgi:hypothetical protein
LKIGLHSTMPLMTFNSFLWLVSTASVSVSFPSL